jgi:Raf kinase inhibitor-like YbhB/YbcL family protein
MTPAALAYDPYATSFPTAGFAVDLPGLGADHRLARSAYAREGNRSPAVSWGDLPEGTSSLMITAFDADSPIPGGFWHWLACDLPPLPAGLGEGAGTSDATLPGDGRHLATSMGVPAYAGVNPPPGTGTHRLFVCVTALSAPALDVPVDAGAAQLLIAAIPHTLGRGIAVGLSDAPAHTVG